MNHIQKSIENVVKKVWQMIRPLSKTHKMKTLCQYLRLAEISWCDFHDILEVILPGPYKSTITSSIFNAESSHQPLIQLHYFIDTWIKHSRNLRKWWPMRLANDKYTSKKSKTSRTPEPNPAFAEMVCWDFNDIFGKKFLIMHYSSHLSCSKRKIITSPK